MRRLIPFFLLAMLLPLGATAAPDAATQLAGEVRSRLADSPVVRGEFIQTRQLSGVKKPLKAEGRFIVARERGVVWRTEKPFAQTLRVAAGEILQRDGDTVLMRLSADKEPTVAAISQVLFGVLAGNFEQLGRYFELSGKVDGTHWELALKPREKAIGRLISEIRLQGAAAVEQVVIDSPSGDQTRIEMRKLSFARELDKSEATQFD